MNNTFKLGARLRAARKAAGFKTSKEFVLKHNIPASTYSQHESGQRHPNDDTLENYCELFGVQFEWLKTGLGNAFGAEANAEIDPTRQNIIAEETFEISDAQAQNNLNQINDELLAKVLEGMMAINQEISKPVSIKKMAKLAAGIYNDIVTIESDPKYQIKMIKPALSSFKYLFNR